MIAVIDTPIDRDEVRRAVERPEHGAVLLFEGVARNNFEGKAVRALEYEAYPAMAVAEMQRIADEATEKWPGIRIAMVHRTGRLAIGEPSVILAVGSPHRVAAYEANRYLIEELKKRVPVWKKEVYDDGVAWKANAP